jgi:hypothetical protein
VTISGAFFYVFGGRSTNTADSVTSSTLSYNPVATNPDDPSIFGLAPMNSRRYSMGYAADTNGYAYAIGGIGNNNAVLATVERYDRISNVWTFMASMPVGRCQFGAAFDGSDNIYIFGGRTNVTAGAETDTVLSYSISGNTWSNQPSMLVPTSGSTTIFGADGKFYVIGGTSGGVVTNLVQVYDPSEGSWQFASPLPTAVTMAGGAVDNLGRLVVLGGADGNGIEQTTTWVSQQLNLPDAAPAFVAPLPATKANITVPYTYTAHAGGNPQATYQLVTAPDGMQIDFYSGALTWTPHTNQFGTNIVSILATNYSASATQTFAIDTLGPPLSPPTNLVELAVNDNSVTVGWDPVPSLVGPMTYEFYLRTFVHSPRGSGGSYVYTLLASGLTNNSITVGGLAPDTSRTYVVKSAAAGVVSGYSAAISIVTTRPQPPTNLRLTALASTTTDLAWDPSPGPVPIVYYSLFDYGPNYIITPVPGAGMLTNTFVHLSGLTPGSTHSYFLEAYDAQGYASTGTSLLAVWNPTQTPVTLSDIAPNGTGGFQFTIQAGLPQTTWVQATTDPTDPTSWVTIATNPPTSGTFTFVDPDTSLFPMRFYRVITQ